MTSVLVGQIILTPTQPVGSGRPQQESNPGPPYQESRALSTELQCAPPPPPAPFDRSLSIKNRVLKRYLFVVVVVVVVVLFNCRET